MRCNISQDIAYIRVPASESDFSSSSSSSRRVTSTDKGKGGKGHDSSDPLSLFAPKSQILVSNLKLSTTSSSIRLLLASSSSHFRLIDRNMTIDSDDASDEKPSSLAEIALNANHLPREFDLQLKVLYWEIESTAESAEHILVYCTDNSESLTCILKYNCPSPGDMLSKLGWLFAGAQITAMNVLVKYYDSNFGIVHAVRSDSTEIVCRDTPPVSKVGAKRRLSGLDTIQEVAREEALFALSENFRSRFTAIRSSLELYSLYPNEILRGCEIRVLRDMIIRAPESPWVYNGSKVMIAEAENGERILCLVDNQLLASLSITSDANSNVKAYALCLEVLSASAAADISAWSLSSAPGAVMLGGGSTGLNDRVKHNAANPMILRLLSVENV